MSDNKLPDHHANVSGTSFQNPWDVQSLQAGGQVFTKLPSLAWARGFEDHPSKPIESVKPTFGVNSPDEGVIKATWVGHAGYLVQLPKDPSASGQPTRILFDPIWSNRASATQYAGPHRRLPPPCTLDELPDVHFVVTSHNHYDHLDWPTIEKIYKLRGENVHFIVPLGNKSWFKSGGIPAKQITEMDWGHEADLHPSGGGPPVKFICTPAQHGSGRGIRDQRATLWASWVAKQTAPKSAASVYHAGDTGYMTQSGPCPAFKEIGAAHGPFDLALVPIWRGGSLSFVASMGLRLTNTELLDGLHASPAHAVQLAADVRARHTLGMHFATFAGSDAEAREPLVELSEAKEVRGVGDWHEEGGFGVIDVGETAVVPIGQSDATKA